MTHVLIVDDKPENRYLLSALLKGHGYTAAEASDGADALAKINQSTPDLIISDLLMPLMDGYMLLGQCKADERFRDIPFIVYTATYTDPKDERLALKLGADAFILKPTEPDDFLIRVQEVLAREKRNHGLSEDMSDEKAYSTLREYSEVLVNKLEKKAIELAEINRALQVRNNLYAMLARTNRALISSKSREALFPEICEIAVETGRFRFAWIGIPQLGQIKLVASAGDDNGYLAGLTVTLELGDPRSYGPTAQAFLTGKPVVVNDLLKSPHTASWHEQARQAGIAASAAFPLKERGETVAVLTLYASSADFFNEDMLTTLSEIAPGISFALDAIVQEADRKRAVETILENERLLRVAFNSVDLAAFRQDKDLKYSWMYNAQLGYMSEDAVGKTDVELLPPRDAAKIIAIKQEVLNTGKSSRSEVEVTGDDKVTHIFELSLEPVWEMGEIVGLIGSSLDITDRKRGEAQLRLRDRALKAVSQGIVITDPRLPDNPVIYVSPSFEHLTGYSMDEALGKNCRYLQGQQTDPASVAQLREAIREGRSCTVEMLNYRKDGKPFWNSLTVSPVLNDNGELTHFVGVQTDVTERRQLEEQFRQAQKMEAVGRLAGGVAHDFNNLLTAIKGFSELTLMQLGQNDPLRGNIEEIRKAGNRAAKLTRQLLAFSRRQVLQPRLLDLNQIITDISAMLARLIGENIEIKTSLMPNLSPVSADPSQIEQVIVNLVVNASDAMPQGGKLTIETANVELSGKYDSELLNIAPGPYVMLAISDTGVGMDKSIKERIFEPFFTTKELGRGTGLGLSTTYGIVRQSGGDIKVYSEPGLGTTFRIYLPLAVNSAEQRQSHQTNRGPVKGSETVLLIEDDGLVANIAETSLAMHGYKVLRAQDGPQAIAIAEQHTGPLQLVLTDVVMPRMNGREVADRIRTVRPETRVLFMSGYNEDTIIHHSVLDEGADLLEKPFTPESLCRRVRDILDRN